MLAGSIRYRSIRLVHKHDVPPQNNSPEPRMSLLDCSYDSIIYEQTRFQYDEAVRCHEVRLRTLTNTL